MFGEKTTDMAAITGLAILGILFLVLLIPLVIVAIVFLIFGHVYEVSTRASLNIAPELYKFPTSLQQTVGPVKFVDFFGLHSLLPSDVTNSQTIRNSEVKDIYRAPVTVNNYWNVVLSPVIDPVTDAPVTFSIQKPETKKPFWGPLLTFEVTFHFVVASPNFRGTKAAFHFGLATSPFATLPDFSIFSFHAEDGITDFSTWAEVQTKSMQTFRLAGRLTKTATASTLYPIAYLTDPPTTGTTVLEYRVHNFDLSFRSLSVELSYEVDVPGTTTPIVDFDLPIFRS